MLYHNIEDLIGNTPTLKISGERYGLRHTDIYMKLEYLNPFGSIKDRTALGLTKGVLDTLSPEYGLIESSSGNTAKALALLASRRGARLTSVTNRIKVPEVEDVLRYLDVELIGLPGRSQCADPSDKDNAVNVIYAMLQANPKKYYHTNQYHNNMNTQSHIDSTAPELYVDVPHIDIFVSGVGTGGSSGGVIEYAQKHNKDTKFIGVMAEPSDFLPGIRTRTELFETALFNESMYDDLQEVSSQEALVALRDLVLNEGVLAGPTTGANFAAAIAYAKANEPLDQSGPRRTIACIACDRLEGYMSYISKRQPELFARTGYTDIYTTQIDAEQRKELEKPATEETYAWVQSDDVQVVDTRGVKPFMNFHIPHSMSYPEEHLREILETGTPFSPDKPLLLVCPTGDRSLLLAALMRQRGVNAYSLAGGLMAWRRARLPLQRKARHAAE